MSQLFSYADEPDKGFIYLSYDNLESARSKTITPKNLFQPSNNVPIRNSNVPAVLTKSASATQNSRSIYKIANDLLELQKKRSPNGSNLTGYSNLVTSASYAFNNNNNLSDIETAILRSTEPIEISETEEISVNGQRGLWANKTETANWRGPVPITQYTINEDLNPEIITKQSHQTLEYIQELAIRYLRPPTPPQPGEIIINQLPNVVSDPAPPIIIRQQPPRPVTPEPLVIREAPPPPPGQVGRKIITISGKRIPPPPRKVIVERLAPIPSKPQSVIIERWLPYSQVKRRVIFNKACERDPIVVKPKNIIVQWSAPQVQIKREFRYLGIIRANPVDYINRYRHLLKTSNQLPSFVTDIPTPEGLTLAANYYYNPVHELEGDVDALRLINLDREGLSEYKSYLANLLTNSKNYSNSNQQQYLRSPHKNNNYQQNFFATSPVGASTLGSTIVSSLSPFVATTVGDANSNYMSKSITRETTSVTGCETPKNLAQQSTSPLNEFIQNLFRTIDLDQNGRISVSEAEKILLRINSRLDRKYGEDDVEALFQTLDVDRDGTIDFQEFKAGFLSLGV